MGALLTEVQATVRRQRLRARGRGRGSRPGRRDKGRPLSPLWQQAGALPGLAPAGSPGGGRQGSRSRSQPVEPTRRRLRHVPEGEHRAAGPADHAHRRALRARLGVWRELDAATSMQYLEDVLTRLGRRRDDRQAAGETPRPPAFRRDERGCAVARPVREPRSGPRRHDGRPERIARLTPCEEPVVGGS